MNTVSREEECPCMKRVRERKERMFKKANKSMEFTTPQFELRPNFFQSGLNGIPVRYVFSYRDIFGDLNVESCNCIKLSNWRNQVPESLKKTIDAELKEYQHHSLKQLCRCGRKLYKSLIEQYPHKIPNLTQLERCPPIFVYSIDGFRQEQECTCGGIREEEKEDLEDMDNGGDTSEDDDVPDEF